MALYWYGDILVLDRIRLEYRSICDLGYYVIAGIPIRIEVVEQNGASGWSARIGCHSDDLGVRENVEQIIENSSILE